MKVKVKVETEVQFDIEDSVLKMIPIKTEINDVQLDKALNDNLQFEVITENDFKIPVSMKSSATVNGVIDRIISTNKKQDLNEYFDLSIGNRVLSRKITLHDASIKYGSKLKLTERIIQIFVNDFDEKVITLRVRRSDKVETLKKQLPPCQHRLIFGGKQLEDHRTLKYYNIRDGSSIQMAGRLLGGGDY